jgi:hypothetical protein
MAAVAVVYKENTLGYVYDDAKNNQWMGVWASKIGGYDSNSGILLLDKANTRPATLTDFDTFRVKYHPSFRLVDSLDGIINWNFKG